MSNLFLQSATAFCSALIATVLLAKIAPVLGLIDKPADRKRHHGDVPLVGGIAIFVALIAASLLQDAVDQAPVMVNSYDARYVFIFCGAFLVFTGALDDKYQLGVLMRVLSEVLVAIVVIEFLDLRVAYLGDLLGFGLIKIPPPLDYPFTIVAIFGIINSFNMLDGMDGLLGVLALTTLTTFHVLTGTVPSFISVAVGAALCAFLISNLGLVSTIPKTFLGDAGSKLLGFIAVCMLLAAASGQVGVTKLIQPVTALFVVALPLFDMVFTSIRRSIKRGSPFAADRTHIHHLMQDLGFSDRSAVVIIVGLHLSVTFIGLIMNRAGVQEYYQFAIFLSCFGVYGLLVGRLWVVVERLESHSPPE